MKKAKLPKFKTEDEERAFWATHDSTDYVDWSKAQTMASPNLTPEEKARAERAEWRRKNATIHIISFDDWKNEKALQEKAVGHHKDLGNVETIEHMRKLGKQEGRIIKVILLTKYCILFAVPVFPLS